MLLLVFFAALLPQLGFVESLRIVRSGTLGCVFEWVVWGNLFSLKGYTGRTTQRWIENSKFPSVSPLRVAAVVWDVKGAQSLFVPVDLFPWCGDLS